MAFPPRSRSRALPTSRSSRSTVGTATEICGLSAAAVRQDRAGSLLSVRAGGESPTRRKSVVDRLRDLADGRRLMIAFPRSAGDPQRPRLGGGVAGGRFYRVVVVGGRTGPAGPAGSRRGCRVAGQPRRRGCGRWTVAGQGSRTGRLQDSRGDGVCQGDGPVRGAAVEGARADSPDPRGCRRSGSTRSRGSVWQLSDAWRCEAVASTTRRSNRGLLSFNSPLGACPRAKGSATSWTWTWTGRAGPEQELCGRAPSRRGTRRPTRTSWRSCWRWPTTTGFPRTCPFAS